MCEIASDLHPLKLIRWKREEQEKDEKREEKKDEKRRERHIFVTVQAKTEIFLAQHSNASKHICQPCL